MRRRERGTLAKQSLQQPSKSLNTSAFIPQGTCWTQIFRKLTAPSCPHQDSHLRQKPKSPFSQLRTWDFSTSLLTHWAPWSPTAWPKGGELERVFRPCSATYLLALSP